MPWLVTDDARVIASVEIATTRSGRRIGLIHHDKFDGAIVLTPCRWVHTVGMRFELDVAFVDAAGIVIKTRRMRRNRIGRPVVNATYVIEAQAGAFARWALTDGSVIEVRPDHE